MAINYTTLLGLAQPVTGTESNVWGDAVNDQITALLDSAIAGAATISVTAGNVTLTDLDGAADQARMAILILTGTPGTTRNVVAPSRSKTYIVINQSDASAVIKGSATTGVTVRAGQAATCVWNGTDFEIVASGDVDGPASATNTAVPTFDGTTGKLIQNNSGVTIAANVVTATGFTGALNGTLGATTPATVVATQVDITAQGDLRLQDTTGGQYVALQAPGTIATSYTLTLPTDDGTAGQALITDGSGVLSWSTAASGDVYGPASATDNAVARYDGTTGKLIQNSAVTIADDGATVIAANSASDGLRITQIGAGNALLVEDSANPDASPFVVTADGTVIRGYTSPVVTDNYVGTQGTPLIQTHANATTASGLASFVWESSAVSPAPSVILSRSRSATIGSFSSVASGDAIGAINFNGDDGTAFVVGASILASVDGTPGTNDMPGRLVFNTTADGASSPTERMRISSSGAIGIGTALTQVNLYNTRNLSGNVTSYGNYLQATIQSDVTTSAIGYRSALSTVASAFTLSSLYGFYSGQGTIGAGSTVTNQFGFVADSSLTGATNNYGFYSDIASGTGRWNFYAAGTASNYMAGNLEIASTNATALSVVGGATIGNATATTGLTVQSAINWNFSPLNVIRSATNTSTPRLIAMPLGGDSLSSASIGDYNAIWGIYNASPSAASTSSALQGEMALAAYYGHRWYVNGIERGRISNTGVWSLGATAGTESLRVTPVASAVNYAEVRGNVTSGNPLIFANGSDTNIGLNLSSKGVSGNLFYTNAGANLQFVVAHTASAVNYISVFGAPTGSGGYLQASGSDTNIPLVYSSKGNREHAFYTDGNSFTQQFRISHTASAVNYWVLTGAVATGQPSLQPAGSDTNISAAFTTKGTGSHVFYTNNLNSVGLVISHTASAVNYLQVTGGVTGDSPSLSAQGSDANATIKYLSKGTGNHFFYTGTSPALQFVVAPTASAVNYLQVTGGATGNAATMSAAGSDTNIDLALTPKGTGNVRFGTLTANADAPVTGYILIKDSGGTTRKLAVIA